MSEANDDIDQHNTDEPTSPRDADRIDFSTFILSLGTSGMVHLGEAPDPDGRTHLDLDLARQTIDILDMLRDKTRSNLDDDETRLIDDLLYNLRLRFVAAQKKKA